VKAAGFGRSPGVRAAATILRMPPTPRPQGPKPKASVKVPTPPGGGGGPSRGLLIGLGVTGLVVVVAAAGYFAFAGSSGSASADVPKLLQAAGCTLQPVKSEKAGDHSVLTPTGTSTKWNTDPPTSGPHYAVPVLWGAYTAPVNMGQLVHNLEHGGIYILYGKDVPQSTLARLRSFYDAHQNATVLAPLPRLGSTIALGVWTTRSASQPNVGTAYLAKCKRFDEKAYAAFFSAYQGKGPERFPMSSLTPGA
jgi:hypothetical protein